MIEATSIDVRVIHNTNGPTYELLKDVSVKISNQQTATAEYQIPKGFVTNFGSSPRFLWPVIAPTDIIVGSLVHDYLYSKEGRQKYNLSRKQADKLLKTIVSCTCNKKTAWACYKAVRIFGSKFFCVT